ncbi:MAG TPA: hypothetical protein VEW03_11190 [Longimicrobiaceae bacterium]|nr:hypothetical protein [Longimicrobiaceae bacterium]
MRRRLIMTVLAVACAISWGCSRDARDGATPAAANTQDAAAAAAAAETPTTGSYVDSILLPEEEERRFREGLAEVVSLAGGAESREALVRGLVRAVERADTLAVRAMILSRAEFAYLYYPSSASSRPPRRTSPALLWFLAGEESEKGIGRLLARYGGAPLGYLRHRCGPAPRVEGGNRLWEGCVVALRTDGEEREMRLFGPIIERGGRFKFVSYQNDL